MMGEELIFFGEGICLVFNFNFYGNFDCYDGEFWFFGNGVYINSGVGNYWYYLLLEGGSGVNDLGDVYEIDGVGIDVVVQIVYCNFVFYFMFFFNYVDVVYYV